MGERVTFADLLKKAEDKKKAESKLQPEVIETSTKAEAQPTPPTTLTPRTAPTKATPPTPPTANKMQSIAPERDFARVANSIVRDAVPQGLFIGKSKQIYDFLYLQTRGAIQPKRSVRITKSNLMQGSDIGSERTLLKNLGHLKYIGLLKITEFDGQHGGNEYEVFLPEETQATPPTPPTARQSRYSLQKVGTLPPVESGVSGVGQSEESKGVTAPLRLNTKTNINDDEVLQLFFQNFDKVSRELTGKGMDKKELERWGKLAELLILELHAAARHTQVSSVPAFLTEHLRRKLLNVPVPKQTKVKVDVVGKNEEGEYEIKSLDKKGRELALEHLRDFADDPTLEDFRQWYTKEDWEWLRKELGKEE